jgi:hypothetical protein
MRGTAAPDLFLLIALISFFSSHNSTACNTRAPSLVPLGWLRMAAPLPFAAPAPIRSPMVGDVDARSSGSCRARLDLDIDP